MGELHARGMLNPALSARNILVFRFHPTDPTLCHVKVVGVWGVECRVWV